MEEDQPQQQHDNVEEGRDTPTSKAESLIHKGALTDRYVAF